MTRRISHITAIVGAALVFAVPAWGDNWASDKSQQATASSPDWFERAATVAVQKHEAMLNARERALGVNSQPFDARSDGLNRIYGLGEYAPPVVADDRFRIDPSNSPVPASVTQGRDIEWPQVGIGLGLGFAFVLVLYLTTRTTRRRPLAH